jgi:hypothetical protein
MRLRPCLHQFDRHLYRLIVSNVPFQSPESGPLFIFESAMSVLGDEAAPTRFSQALSAV